MAKSVLDGKRILAVDDEPDILEILEEEILSACEDCRLDRARTYEAAVEGLMVMIGWPYSTDSPFSTRMLTTSPSASALISFITFIASMMQITVSRVTVSPTLARGSASGAGDR